MFKVLLSLNNRFLLYKGLSHRTNSSSKKVKEGILSITPILDFKHRLTNTDNLRNNLHRRGQTSKFDVEDLVDQWKIYDSVIKKRDLLETRQKEITKLLKDAKKNKQKDASRKFTLELETIREDLHNFTEHLSEFKDTFILKYLSLPNDIHETTPENLKIVLSHGTPPDTKSHHHLKFEDSIKYHNETCFYLKGVAAKFEHQFGIRCLNHLREQSFIQFCNPDFVQTPILEAVGMTAEDFYEVSEKSDDPTKLIHLVGNGSMHAFMGFIARLRVYSTLLPLQWMTIGKSYTHIDRSNDDGLFDVCQSSVVQIFQAGTEEQMIEKFEHTLKFMSELFKELDIHFRIVYVPAKELGPAESLSAKVEMFSPNHQQYVEVGNLIYYGDYISKRLLFSYVEGKENKMIAFPHIISETVCNLTRVVAIVLEVFNGAIPTHLSKYVSSK